MSDARPVLRFVFADPEKFGEREVGERWVAGELNDAGEAEDFFKFPRLFFGALITPNDGRANDVARGVQQNRAMHLTGEADTRHVIGSYVCLLHRFFYRCATGAPPIEWVLFGPAILWRCKRLMLMCAGCDDSASFVNEKRTRTGGSNVNAQKELDDRLR